MRGRQRPGPRPELAKRLRAARAARGLTQQVAAAELGIATSALAAFETGSRKARGLDELALRAWAAECLGEKFSMIPSRRTGR